MNEAGKQALLSALRAILVAGGTAYATKNGIDGETVQTVVGGIMVLIPVLWGIADKYIAERKTQTRVEDAVSVAVDATTTTAGRR